MEVEKCHAAFICAFARVRTSSIFISPFFVFFQLFLYISLFLQIDNSIIIKIFLQINNNKQPNSPNNHFFVHLYKHLDISHQLCKFSYDLRGLGWLVRRTGRRRFFLSIIGGTVLWLDERGGGAKEKNKISKTACQIKYLK